MRFVGSGKKIVENPVIPDKRRSHKRAARYAEMGLHYGLGSYVRSVGFVGTLGAVLSVRILERRKDKHETQTYYHHLDVRLVRHLTNRLCAGKADAKAEA